MWLTGFDVPSLATMYVYKPMSGHNLMQAIARVNRVFGDVYKRQIWDAACELWGHIPAADYRKVIVGLIFLRYISCLLYTSRCV